MVHFTIAERDIQVHRMNQLVLTWNDREDSCLVSASRSTKLTGTSHYVVRQDVKLIFSYKMRSRKRDKRCEWTRAEITLPYLVPKSALVQTSFHTMTRVGKEVDNVGSMNEVITIDSKDNRPSLVQLIPSCNVSKQTVSSCIIYDAGPCLVLAGKVLLLKSGQTALTLNTIKQVLSTQTIDRIFTMHR